MPEFVGTPRKAPLAITHPVRVRQGIRVKLDGEWDLEGEYEEFRNRAFRFEDKRTFEDGTFSSITSYHSKNDRIEVENLKETMESLKKIHNSNGVHLVTGAGPFNPEEFGALYFAVVVLVSIIWAIAANFRKEDWIESQVFYPVSLPKFLTHMVATMGFYSLYWIYKNWAWIKYSNGKNIWSSWRAIFHPLTNFSLFVYFKNQDGGLLRF